MMEGRLIHWCAIKRHRAAAFDILDRYVSAAPAASASVSKYHVVKVVGR